MVGKRQDSMLKQICSVSAITYVAGSKMIEYLLCLFGFFEVTPVRSWVALKV